MNRLLVLTAVLLLAACEGTKRGCSAWSAEQFASDWIVVQYRFDGTPISCWKLANTSVANESHTDGVYWKSPGGHLIHISGWYNRIQVMSGRYGEAAAELGLKLSNCTGGVYSEEKTP